MAHQETQYQVLEIEKAVSIGSELEKHVNRMETVTDPVTEVVTTQVWIPDNADKSRTHLNRNFISHAWKDEDGVEREHTIQEHVEKRIRDAGITKRSGQNTCLQILLSGTHETLHNMDEETLRQWTDDSLQWVKDTFGADNLVHASLHRDEKTPHLHCIVVPITTGMSTRTAKKHKKDKENKREKWVEIDTSRLRLSASDVFRPTSLYKYHDTYYKAVGEKYGMERGVKAVSGAKKKHQDSIDYNRELERERIEREKQIQEQEAQLQEQEAQKQLLEEENQKLADQHFKKTADLFNLSIKQEQIEKNIDALDLEKKNKKIEQLEKEVKSLKEENSGLFRMGLNLFVWICNLARPNESEENKKRLQEFVGNKYMTAFREEIQKIAHEEQKQHKPTQHRGQGV